MWSKCFGFSRKCWRNVSMLLIEICESWRRNCMDIVRKIISLQKVNWKKCLDFFLSQICSTCFIQIYSEVLKTYIPNKLVSYFFFNTSLTHYKIFNPPDTGSWYDIVLLRLLFTSISLQNTQKIFKKCFLGTNSS